MPQIAQLTADNWYLASQLFWLLVVFAGIYVVIGRGMLPKIEATVDARDRKVADDLAAAKAAHAAADGLEETYRQQSDASRAAAQKAVSDAKDKAARDAERLAKVDAANSAKSWVRPKPTSRPPAKVGDGGNRIGRGRAAGDLVAKLSGAKVAAADVKAAVKLMLHG